MLAILLNICKGLFFVVGIWFGDGVMDAFYTEGWCSPNGISAVNAPHAATIMRCWYTPTYLAMIELNSADSASSVVNNNVLPMALLFHLLILLFSSLLIMCLVEVLWQSSTSLASTFGVANVATFFELLYLPFTYFLRYVQCTPSVNMICNMWHNCKSTPPYKSADECRSGFC